MGRYKLSLADKSEGKGTKFFMGADEGEEKHYIREELTKKVFSFPYLYIFDLDEVVEAGYWTRVGRDLVGFRFFKNGLVSFVKPSKNELYVLKFNHIWEKDAPLERIESEDGSRMYEANDVSWENYCRITDLISSPSWAIYGHKYRAMRHDPINLRLREAICIANKETDEILRVYEVDGRGYIIATLHMPLEKSIKEYVEGELGKLSRKEEWEEFVNGTVVAVSQDEWLKVLDRNGREFQRYTLIAYSAGFPRAATIYYRRSSP